MGRVIGAFAVVGVLAALGAAGTAGEKAGKKDADRILGTWSVVSGEKEGQKAPEEEFKDVKITFGADGKLTARNRGKEHEGTYKLDAAKKPRQIDVTIEEGGKEMTFKGIYELKKDSLKICLAHPPDERPSEFATQAGVKTMLLVFQRDKK